MEHDIYDELFKDARHMLDDMNNGILIVQKKADSYPVLYANKALEQLIKKHIVSYHFDVDLLQIISPKDRGKYRDAIHSLREHETINESYRLVDADGNEWWQLACHKLSVIGDQEYIIISYTDIHQLMGMQDQLMQDHVKWTTIVNSIPAGLGVFQMDDGVTKTLDINDQLISVANSVGKMLDNRARNWTREELMMIFNQSIFSFVVKEDIPLVQKMLDDSRGGSVTTSNFRLRGSTQENTVWMRSMCSCYIDEHGHHIYYITFANATKELNSAMELQKSHQKLTYISRHDPLTQIMNRNVYHEVIEHAKANPLYHVGFVFADVNGLKNTNDTYGHRFGDDMICQFVDILRQEFEEEQIYRISGDEFVIICPDIIRHDFLSRMRNIQDFVREADNIASIGYLWEEKVINVKQAVVSAEQLMYVEKQQYYATQMQRVSKHRSKTVNQLLEELANGQYQMYLQPKSNISDSVIVGAEALVRKFDSNGNLVFPDEFIPQLEKERLIPRVDYYMLEEVCKTLERWKKENRQPIKISVNLSRVTLAENDFFEHIMEICNKYQIDRSLLEFEITESTDTMDHFRLAEEVIAIHQAGFSVSLDDMGTDYSALKMLLIDGIEMVKLDRSFILQMDTRKGNTLLKHIIKMSHEIGLQCIAEGVEDDKQRLELQEMGCDMYQGYLLSRPIPIEQFEELVEKHNH